MSFPISAGALHGFGINNAGGDADHDIVVSAGFAKTVGEIALSRGTTLTKQIDAVWAAGDAAGGLPAAVTLSADTWYHVFVIRTATGAVDAGFDTSPTAANLVAAAGGGTTAYRRIGSVLTDSSANILAFIRAYCTFWWVTQITEVSVTDQSTAGINRTMRVPPDVRCLGMFTGQNRIVGAASSLVRLYPTDGADSATASGLATSGIAVGTASEFAIFQTQVLTNTARQIRSIASAADTVLILSTQGWLDLDLLGGGR